MGRVTCLATGNCCCCHDVTLVVCLTALFTLTHLHIVTYSDRVWTVKHSGFSCLCIAIYHHTLFYSLCLSITHPFFFLLCSLLCAPSRCGLFFKLFHVWLHLLFLLLGHSLFSIFNQSATRWLFCVYLSVLFSLSFLIKAFLPKYWIAGFQNHFI